MESESFEKTGRYLSPLLGYLESIHSSMDWEREDGGNPAMPGGLPQRIVSILSESGYLEGMHLKARGCLSSDVADFIGAVCFAFEIEAKPMGTFKLPFVDNEIRIQRKTLNEFMEKAWLIYHAALLSAYSLRPLYFHRLRPGDGFPEAGMSGEGPAADGLEETLRILEAAPSDAERGTVEGLPGETVHTLNNVLSGILGYVGLVLDERKGDAELQEKLGLVMEAAKRAAAALPAVPPPI